MSANGSGTATIDLIPELRSDLIDWIVELVGGGEASVTPFGHYRPLWSVDVRQQDRTVELFVRGARDSGSVLASVYNLEREAAVIRSLTNIGVPTPAWVGYNPKEQLLVLQRIPGRGDFHNIEDVAMRERVAQRFIQVLADLHAREPAEFRLQDIMTVPSSPQEHALGELEIAEPLFDQPELTPEPIVTFGRQWMRRNVPASVDHTCFIQGDTGPGNFVFHDNDVWLVDLEISHFGDPMEDLAAICIRDMVTPFGDLRELFKQYDRLTPWRLDFGRLRYHRVSKCVRSLMAIISLNEHGHQRGEVLTWWAYRALYVRGACQALAEAMGLEFDALRDPAESRPSPAWSALHDLLDSDLADLREAHGVRADRWTAVLERDLQTAAVLRLANEYGPEFRAREKAQLESLLGQSVATNEVGLRELDDAIRQQRLSCSEVDLLRFLTARADRQCAIVRPAMGPTADGFFSPIQ